MFILLLWGQGRHAETGPTTERRRRRSVKERSAEHGGDGAERPWHIL